MQMQSSKRAKHKLAGLTSGLLTVDREKSAPILFCYWVSVSNFGPRVPISLNIWVQKAQLGDFAPT